jgi:pyrimidine-nucleoside phosphorylase
MRAYDIIRIKRDGGRLPPEAIAWMIDGFTKGSIPDYQMSALLMAIVLRGLDPKELAAWTKAMLESGSVLDLKDIDGAKVDKHSTGGVGDKISLPLAPLVAAAGVRVPMVSGRGLGHTGGTLDKLQSIAGFRVDLDTARYRELVREVGACLIGQTSEIAPADKKLYALRDVTATVESIPLIASSIMSKKLAEGIDALVLDVKTGSGAFMKSKKDASALAKTMCGIGKAMKKKVVAVLTDMDQPLGAAVGNALEVRESIEVLKGRGPADVVELTVELGGHMLVLGGKAKNLEAGKKAIRERIADGSGLAKLREIAVAQGGDGAMIDDPSKLPKASNEAELVSPKAGIVQAIQAEWVGIAALVLGAGREKVEDVIDPAVGVELLAKRGATVRRGEPIARIHYNSDRRLDEAIKLLSGAYSIGRGAVRPRPLVQGVIRA